MGSTASAASEADVGGRPARRLGRRGGPTRARSGEPQLADEPGQLLGGADLLRIVAAARSTALAPRLTPRQHELLRLLARGRGTDEIATDLTIAPDTVRNHVCRLLRRLGARTRLEAVAVAREHGLV